MEEHSTSTVKMHVRGTDNFRCVTLFGSLIAGICTVLLILLNPRPCEEVKLENAMYICFGVHLFIFALLLTSYICSGCVQLLGRGMGLFYLLIIVGMAGV